jgi:hypothetical protein
MNRRTTSRKRDDADHPERRSPTQVRGVARILHLLRNLWARPVGLQRSGLGVKLVLIDRRRRRLADDPPKLTEIRAELRERLLGHEHAHAARVMRHITLVHDELGSGGWPGVEKLPAQVIGMATVQAEMLASVGPSDAMSHLVERLRICKVAADVRDERVLLEKRAARASATVRSEAAETVETAEPAESGLDGQPGAWAGPVPVPVPVDRNV